MIAAFPRWAATTAARRLALLAAVATAALLVLSPGPTAAVASRAALVVAALGVATVWIRRRPAPRATPALAVVARAQLAGSAGLAVVEVGGRRLVVGFGRDGVSLLAEVRPPGEARP